jgi:O-antigen/teichoic acid export membrane protein
MKQGRGVTSGLKWQAIDIVARQGLSVVIFALLARLLDPTSFGLIGLVAVYLGLVGMFAEQGIIAAIVQRADLKEEHLHAAFWFNLSFATTLCLVTILSANPVAEFLGDQRLAPLLQWSSLALVINGMASVHTGLFIRAMDFRRPAIRTIMGTGVGGIVGVGMALSGWGVWSLVGQQLAFSIAGCAFLWLASPYRPKLSLSLAHLREILRFASSVFASALLWFFSSRIDQVLIGRFLGLPALGLYVIASKLTEMAKLVTHQPVAAVSLPALSRLQGDHEKLRRTIYEGMRYNAAISFAVFMGLAAVATEVVPLVFGDQWTGASMLCALLCVNALVAALQVFFHPALLATGGVGRYLVLTVLGTGGVLVACLIGAQISTAAVIVGLIINSLVMSVPALLFLRSRFGLEPLKYWRPCLIPAVAAAVMWGSTWLVSHALEAHLSQPVLLVTKIALGAGVYLGLLRLADRAVFFDLFKLGWGLMLNRPVKLAAGA